MNRHALTDREWGRLAPLLPPRPRKGRPPKAHRLILDALLWLARTGDTQHAPISRYCAIRRYARLNEPHDTRGLAQ